MILYNSAANQGLFCVSAGLFLCISYIWGCFFTIDLIEFARSYPTAQTCRSLLHISRSLLCISYIWGCFSKINLVEFARPDPTAQTRRSLLRISRSFLCIGHIWECLLRSTSSSSRDLIQQRRHAGLFIASMGLFCVVWIYECILLKVRLIRLYELDFARPYPTAWPPRCVCKRERATVRVWESKNYSLSLTHTLSGPRSRSRSLLRAHSLSCSLPLSLPPSH